MKILELLFGWMLGAAAFFDSLNRRRFDDPITARHRALTRACFWSTVLPFILLGLSFLLANAFNAFSDALRNPAAIEDFRPAVSYLVLGAPAVAVLVAVYNCWKLWHFESGGDDAV